ncbi:hypothetical protein ACIN8IBEIGE_220008 [Acinetobacter sp. 8I-beige]|nr:hypothetical protein ACIN8IBEIGE_220008 [Acinetobacter sp. 8I-beige]
MSIEHNRAYSKQPSLRGFSQLTHCTQTVTCAPLSKSNALCSPKVECTATCG